MTKYLHRKWHSIILVLIFFVIIIIFRKSNLFTGLIGEAKSNYTLEDAIYNFNNNENKILDLVYYYNKVTASIKDEKAIMLGFNKKKINIAYYSLNGKVDEADQNWGKSNININSPYLDSFLIKTGLHKIELDSLLIKLRYTNCISISDKDPIVLKYNYSGLGLYSYYIFKDNMADSVKEMYKGEFNDYIIRKNVVIVYTNSL